MICALLALQLCCCDQKKKAAPKPDAAKAAPLAGPPLKITDISFAGPAGHRPDADFARGETILCLFTMSNFTYDKGQAHIRAQIRVLGPGQELVLHQPDLELLKGKAPTLVPGTIRSMAKLPLTPAAPAGRYTVKLILKDVLGNRTGQEAGSFTILGQPPQKADTLTIDDLRLLADDRVPPESVVPITFEVRGFSVRKVSPRDHLVDLSIKASLMNSAGESMLRRREETLVQTQLRFAPLAFPVEHQFRVPKELKPGQYEIAIVVRDKVSNTKAKGALPLRVAPARLGIVNPHVHDAGGLSRSSFLLGEQIFIRLSVFGLKKKNDMVDAAMDLAVAGPHGGVYLMRKEAAAASGLDSMPIAKAGRYPVQIPLVLPTLAPTGVYQIVFRARDKFARKEVERRMKIQVRGNAPRPMGSFKVDDVEVRRRPDLPLLKGDTFGAGRTYHLVLKLGGMKLEKINKRTFRVAIEGNLRLLNLQGEIVHEQKKLFSIDRRMTYQPLRVLPDAQWEVPSDLPGGLYDLQLSALNLHDDRVSQLSRRVEIVSASQAVPVQIP